jgi:4-(gamma-glutamylamino)butanal dehydrogenase
MTTVESPSVLRVVNPTTGEPNTTLPAATAEDVAKAAEEAQLVFDSGVWSQLPVRERSASPSGWSRRSCRGTTRWP